METAGDTDLIERQIAAFNARDIEKFVACYAPDARILDASGGAMATGHEAIRQMYTPLFDNSPALHVEVVNSISIGSWVIDDEMFTGFNLPGYPTDLRSVVIYQVAGGTIQQSQILP
jgi:uncharacterized protein (TIGR02246 family)